jgi:hypothetical protein
MMPRPAFWRPDKKKALTTDVVDRVTMMKMNDCLMLIGSSIMI